MTLQSVTAVPQRHGNERVQHCHDGQWHYVQHGEVDHVEGLRVVLDALHDTHCVCQAVGQLRGDSANPDETRGRVERAGHPHKHHHQLQHTHTLHVVMYCVQHFTLSASTVGSRFTPVVRKPLHRLLVP